MAGFTPLQQQFLQLPLSILLDSWHPPPNQHSALLLHLRLPRLLWLSSLPLVLYFKLQHFSQNMPIVPPQHMPVASHSIRLFHLNGRTYPWIPLHSSYFSTFAAYFKVLGQPFSRLFMHLENSPAVVNPILTLRVSMKVVPGLPGLCQQWDFSRRTRWLAGSSWWWF